MILQGSFRVVDSWQGAGKTGEKRASATLLDVKEGGQLRVSFSDGIVPQAFALDAVVSDLVIRPRLFGFNTSLDFVGFSSSKSK